MNHPCVQRDRTVRRSVTAVLPNEYLNGMKERKKGKITFGNYGRLLVTVLVDRVSVMRNTICPILNCDHFSNGDHVALEVLLKDRLPDISLRELVAEMNTSHSVINVHFRAVGCTRHMEKWILYILSLEQLLHRYSVGVSLDEHERREGFL